MQQQRVFHDLRRGEGAHSLAFDGLDMNGNVTDRIRHAVDINEKQAALESSDEELKRVPSVSDQLNRWTFFLGACDQSGAC